jgi:VWFA-related protein
MAVLVDMSGSMRLDSKLTFAREVLKRLTSELQDGRDEVGLFTFGSAVQERVPFTVHPQGIEMALDNEEPFGQTSLYDAIGETARRLGERPSPRRAIVVVTDGIDTGSALSPAEVSALASSIDAPVYVVVTAPAIDRERYLARAVSRHVQASSDLRDLALWTGGDLLWVTAGPAAGLCARQILAELRHQYLIAIESASEDAWRPIDVRVRNPRLSVRARSGYFSRDNQLAR